MRWSDALNGHFEKVTPSAFGVVENFLDYRFARSEGHPNAAAGLWIGILTLKQAGRAPENFSGIVAREALEGLVDKYDGGAGFVEVIRRRDDDDVVEPGNGIGEQAELFFIFPDFGNIPEEDADAAGRGKTRSSKSAPARA